MLTRQQAEFHFPQAIRIVLDTDGNAEAAVFPNGQVAILWEQEIEWEFVSDTPTKYGFGTLLTDGTYVVS